MKYYITSILIFVFILSGCDNQKIISNEYEFKEIYNDNHFFTFKLHFENIGNNEKTKKIINSLIYNDKNFDEFKNYTGQKFINDITKNNYPKLFNDDRSVYIYQSELDSNYSIVFHDDQFIIFENKLYSYAAGAAHGMQKIEYIIVDLKEKKTLKKIDLINQMPEKLLKEHIFIKYNKNDFLREEIWPPDTINFHNETVELIWNTYTILPYADGIINLDFTKDTIKQYLTKKGKKLLLRVTAKKTPH